MPATGLGIIAGGGALPCAVAQNAKAAGRKLFVVALRDICEAWAADFPHEWISLGQVGKSLRLFREHGCADVVLAGYVSRPNFLALRFDAKGLSLLPRVIWAMRGGDDGLLRTMVAMFEREGFSVKSVTQVAPDLQIPLGVLGKIVPAASDEGDIAFALSAARKQGVRDIGQAVVVSDGRILAMEDDRGTDDLLARVAKLPPGERGPRGRGVLAKALKPIQDGRTDLPTIGVATVANAAIAGLAGIAVEAGTALILDRAAVIAEADKRGLFVVGVARQVT